MSARAAGQLYGDLPSFGWALLVPLERDGDQRCSALAAAGRRRRLRGQPPARRPRAAGYVERRPDPHDGRASLLRLTRAGADALAAARALRADWALSALSGWDEADAEPLSDLLDRLVPTSRRSAAHAAMTAVPTAR